MLENFHKSEDGFWGYHSKQNRSPHVKEHEILRQKIRSERVCIFVRCHFSENMRCRMKITYYLP